MKKFSIIAISLNQARLLQSCLRSLLSLDYESSCFEIIVVDDGSVPKLNDLIDEGVMARVHYIYLPRNERSCRSSARNIGARSAKNDYIVFIDGDHIVEPSFLTLYDRFFSIKKDRNLVLGTRREVHRRACPAFLHSVESKKELPNSHLNAFYQDERISLLEKLPPLNQLLGKWQLFWSCNFVIKKEAYQKVGGFDEDFLRWGLEDIELGYRLSHAGERFELIDNYVWHLHAGPKESDDPKYRSWVENLKLFYSKHPSDDVLQQYNFEKLFFYKMANHKERPPPDLSWAQCYLEFEARLQYLSNWQS